MPELPEVETTLQGLRPHLEHQRVASVQIRENRLRRPVDAALPTYLTGQRILACRRRAKYLLLIMDDGALLIHLGMSGTLRILPEGTSAGRHDHVDILLESGSLLRFNDPRRFGLVLWTTDAPLKHELLAHLGPEPLGEEWDGASLWQAARGRRVAIKGLLMDNKVVVGVGNIYANEALFMVGIRPARQAGRIARRRMDLLVDKVRAVLSAAILQGGTTLRDFVAEDGKPGYFSQSLLVYGRTGLPCPKCGTTIRVIRQLGRSSWFCPVCQR